MLYISGKTENGCLITDTNDNVTEEVSKLDLFDAVFRRGLKVKGVHRDGNDVTYHVVDVDGSIKLLRKLQGFDSSIDWASKVKVVAGKAAIVGYNTEVAESLARYFGYSDEGDSVIPEKSELEANLSEMLKKR